MKAIILAAGMGKRLKQFWDKPKSLFEINGKSILEYSLDALVDSGIKEIIIIVGYKGETIKEKIGDEYKGTRIVYTENKLYETMDTMYSFFMTKNLVDDNVLILEGDLLYEHSAIKRIMESKHSNLIVVSKPINEGSDVLVSSEDEAIIEIGMGDGDENILGEFVGISKLSKEFVKEMLDYYEREHLHKDKRIYFEKLIHDFAKRYGKSLAPFLISDLVWGDLDKEEDVERLKKEIFPRVMVGESNKKIKKVLLINPSVKILSDSLKRLTTPLGLISVGGFLKKNGYEVEIINSPCEGYENERQEGENHIVYGLSDDEMIKRIRNFDPDLIGIGNLFSAQEKNTIHHCQLAKKAKDVPVVVGGIHPTLAPEEVIKSPFVDYVVIGEGEHRFLNLINGLNEDKPDFDFDGIAYKKGQEIFINPMTSRIDDLDEFGSPDRSLVDVEKYLKAGVFYSPFPRKRRVERIMTSRGCPFNCVFCAYSTGKKLVFRSVGNIIEEIEELVNKYKIEEIQFSDDNLTFNRERAMDLFRRLKPYNLSWCTPNGIMVRTLDEEMIKLMAESGAYQLTFNIESGSQRVLREIIDKVVPEKEKVKELVRICHDNGIQVHGQLMIGLPGETREEIEQTLNYPYEVEFDSVSFFIANPLPGSRLFEICKEKGYLKKDRKVDFKSSEIVIPKDDPNFVMPGEEMERLVEEATRKYNEFIKEKYPERWNEKFKVFLQMKSGASDSIKGRVT